MSDLISRQDAIDALDGEITVTGRANAEAVRGYARLVADRLKRLPSAQPERKRGRWVDDGERYGLDHKLAMWECDQCGETIWAYLKDPRRWNYCPNCGAKMDEVTE